MIDTISIRIHGINDLKKSTASEIKAVQDSKLNLLLPVHNELYIKMLKYKGRYYSSKANKVVENNNTSLLNQEEYNLMNFEDKFSKHLQIRDVMTMSDENYTKTFFKSVNGKFSLTSGYSGITFNINDNQGFIQLQWSVPKHVFGHSLGQFVTQKYNDDYIKDFSNLGKMKYHKLKAYDRFISHVESFLSDVCFFFGLNGAINMNYVELMRIDFCFNQYFLNKTESLKYLDRLKSVHDTRHRNKINTQVYKTSLAVTTAMGLYFKIYHKGTEYVNSKSGDLAKHIAVNNKMLEKHLSNKQQLILERNISTLDKIWNDIDENGKIKGLKKESHKNLRNLVQLNLKYGMFNIPFFKRETDKILRYELSVKGSYLSYVYKRKVFRKHCDIHTDNYGIYIKVKKILDARNSNTSIEDVSRLEYKRYHSISKWLNTKTCLMLGSSRLMIRNDTYGAVDLNKGKYNITKFETGASFLDGTGVNQFSHDMFNVLLDKFLGYHKAYQAEIWNKSDNINMFINDYNKDVVKRQQNYNKQFNFLTFDGFGNKMMKGKSPVKAIHLLKRKDLLALRLKKVNQIVFTALLQKLKEGKTLKIIRYEMNLSDNQYFRIKEDLKMLGFKENSVFVDTNIDTDKTFNTYYRKLETDNYFINHYTYESSKKE